MWTICLSSKWKTMTIVPPDWRSDPGSTPQDRVSAAAQEQRWENEGGGITDHGVRLRSHRRPAVNSEENRMKNTSLTALSREQLDLAKQASSGRSAHTVYGGHEHALRQTVIALAAGHQLGEHSNPGEATVHVLHGRVRLAAGDVAWDGAAGHLITVPDAPHTLEALEDAVVILTTVTQR